MPDNTDTVVTSIPNAKLSPERTITYTGHGGRSQLVYDSRMFN